MSPRIRGVVVLVSVLLVVALVIWARGDEHHRGDDVGSGSSVVAR